MFQPKKLFRSSTALKMFTLSNQYKVQLALLSALACSTLGASQANATNYYISPAGDNTSGTSYSTAWRTFSKIPWTKLQSSDNIIIDGGTNGVVYNQSISVPPNGASGLHVKASSDQGHNGQVILDGTHTLPVGININSSVNINGGGGSATGLLVRNFTSSGVRFETNAINCSLHYMEITGNGMGIYVVPGLGATQRFGSYVPPYLAYLTVHDNNTYNVYGRSECLLIESWIYGSSNAPASPVYGAVMNNQYVSGGGVVDALGCVFGPGLTYGLVAGSGGSELSANGCLFIDAATANVEILQPTNSTGAQQVSLAGCTSFSTKKNAKELGHYNILDRRTNSTSGLSIGTTVVYGGAVGIPVSEGHMGAANFQYAVTGNTTALAASQVDPGFNTNVAAIADNASVTALTNTDFSLSYGGPAGKVNSGSYVSSVAKLKQIWTQASSGGGGGYGL